MRKKKKHLISSIITMIVMILVISILSLILSKLNIDSNQTSIVNGSLETSIVIIKNIFSKEGLIYLFNNINILKPFILVIVSLMCTSIASSSGLLKHIFTPLKKYKSSFITFIVVLLSIISGIIGEYNYIILFPLVGVLYQYINKNPIIGIITVFLGSTLGYATGIYYNYNDFALGVLTEEAAIISVDATYKFNLLSNIYIMLFSLFAISLLLTVLIEKHIKFSVKESVIDDLNTSKEALLSSIATFVILLFPIMILKSVFLDNTQNYLIAKLFSSNAAFNNGFMYLLLIIISITSFVYGKVSNNFKNNNEFSLGFTKEFNNIGYLLVLMLLFSILNLIIDWTNIATFFTNKLITFISIFDFTGIPLIVLTFICIILMSILMPNNLEKWSLISPILVPLFMKGNLTPDFTQFLFKVSDSVGKVISPFYIYFIVMIGFIHKYNKDNDLNFISTIKLLFPIIIKMSLFWLLILILWYIAGLPLGIDSLVTM